jgi:hypothetical protein
MNIVYSGRWDNRRRTHWMMLPEWLSMRDCKKCDSNLEKNQNYYYYNNKTTWFLLLQKSHECGLIFILCHKNYRKTTFNSGIPHAKFAMTLRRRSHNITLTCPTLRMTSLRIPDTDATEEIGITHMLYLIYLYRARISRLDRRTPRVKFYWVGDSAQSDKLCTGGNISVCILKWFWRGIFAQILQNSEFVRWKSLISGMG